MDFFIPEESALGEAALAGEMLEVSEVMGEGFRPQLYSKDYEGAACVVGICIEQFCSPALLALREETEKPVFLYVIARPNGPLSSSIQKWKDESDNRSVMYFKEEDALTEHLKEMLQSQSSAVLLMSCDSPLCRKTSNLIDGLREGRTLTVITP